VEEKLLNHQLITYTVSSMGATMGNKVLSGKISIYKMLLTPQSMFDYAIAVVNMLVWTRQLDALGIEISMDITRIKKGDLLINMKEPRVHMPVDDAEMIEELHNKYMPIIVNVLTALSSDMKRVNDLFNKALDAGVNETELNSLDYFFGDLHSEVASFLRKISKFKPTQWESLVSKYLSIAFQRLATKAVQRFAEVGAVLWETPTLLSVRLLWFPGAGRGVYDIPSSKVQVLALLKQLLPGLIDYSTDENEYTRLARLALKLNDNFDIDTLIDVITRLYLPGSADLQELLRALNLPKKYIPLMLLGLALSKRIGIYSVIDFEGTSPIIVMYSKILITEANTEGGG
jgi:hypothetical protein